MCGFLNKKIKHVYHRIDYATGKSLFGNTTGLKNNISGKFQNVGKTYETEGANALRTNGFFKLGKIYDDSYLNTIKEKYDKMIEDDKYSFVRISHDGEVYNRQLLNDPCPIPEFSKLLTDQIKNIMNDYFGGNFQIKRIQGSRNYHIPSEILKKQEFYSDHWHCDNRDTDSFWKIFVLLSDVTDKDGPLHLQPRPRTKELMKMGFKTRENYGLTNDELYDSKYLVKHTGPIGTVVIGNPTVCLHRAGVPSLGHHRDMIYLMLGRSDEPAKNDWIDHQDFDDHQYD
jgi:hypothetical protein